MSDLSIGSFNGASWSTAFPGLMLDGHDGIDDMPGMRTADVFRAMDSGEWAGIDLPGGRDFTLDFVVLGETPAGYLALVDTFRAAFGPQYGIGSVALPLTWGVGTNARVLYARCRDRKIPYQPGYRASGPASALMHATDPRIYSGAVHTIATGMATQSSSFVFPVTFPISFGVQSAGAVTVTNAGSVPTPAIVTIHGPATNPAVENITAQQTLRFALTLMIGDALVIDTNARTALLNGVSRRSALDPTSAWWSLMPGDNVVQFRADTFQAAASALLTWQDAWL